MKTYRYYTDDGGLTVGNDDFQIVIPNGYGDGWHELRVYDTSDEDQVAWDEIRSEMVGKVPAWRFFTSFACRAGKAGAPAAFGCCDLEPGRYGAFYHNGTIALVCWRQLGPDD